MCDKVNKIKEILKQICKENPDKYKGLLDYLNDNIKTIEQCIDPLGDDNIKAVYQCLNDKGVLDMADNTIVVCYTKLREHIIQNHLVAYIKQWTEMEINIKDEQENQKTLKVIPPYVINHGTGFVEGNKGLRRYIKNTSETYADKHNHNDSNKNYDFYYYKDAHIGKSTPGVIKEILNPTNLTTEYIKNQKQLEKKIKEMNDPNKFLKDHGIGVDCSGFVSHTIQYVMGQFKVSFKDQNKTFGKYPAGAITLANHTRALADGGKIMNNARELTINNNLSLLKPGDIIVTPEHIKIIYGVGYDVKKEKYYYLAADSSTKIQKKTIVDPNNFNKILSIDTSEKMSGIKLEKHYTIESNVKYARPKFFDDYYKGLIKTTVNDHT